MLCVSSAQYKEYISLTQILNEIFLGPKNVKDISHVEIALENENNMRESIYPHVHLCLKDAECAYMNVCA